ncbi:receptor-like protein Cf-9 [Camellia sinensis]|uniref:receptor-like protein Cf-9 n=1 Tax=Camellia sinensis TaxID=4442 RepID=UPI0010359DCC|nr:receptor-like protein Cf-9 [Camellia sinensis]
MESWKEGSDCCSWDGVECDNNTSQVIGLDLSCSWLNGTIHPKTTIFYYFPHLQSLNLAFNDFGMSPISSEFSRFPSLTHLNLSDSSFSGKVPIEVSFLSKLISLDLSNNYDLRLEEPGFELLVQNLTKVRELNLRDVNISSVVSNSLLNLTSLTLLDLSFCGLLGKLPDGIFHLSHLNELSILYNLALTGYFPEFINSSSPLQYLDLSFTNFSGELPDSIGNLKSLKKLAAYDCKFYGSIPTSLGNLTAMTHLEIGYNNFTGMLPSSLSNLGNLVRLQVAGNNFEGIISDILPNSKSLLYLHAGSNNFSSPFPSLVSNLTSLVELDLSHNQLRGPLPSQIIGFPNLTLLSLDDNLINGTIPSWVFSLPALNHLSIRNNKLTGHVKEFKSTDLNVVDLSNNNLHGMFPSSTFKLEYLYSLILSSNNFSGKLDMLCHAISLHILALSNNSFNGAIPQCLGNFSTVFYVLDLEKNNFSGTIPNTFVKGNRFETINLNGNGFEGPVPKSLVNCKLLEVLDLGCNKFSDKFPYWLEKLQWLQVLILTSNKFHGPMPTSKAKFPFLNLRVMDLSDNYFTGPLPEKYFKNFNAMMNVDEANFKLQYLSSSSGTYYYHLTIVIKGSTIEMEKVLIIFTAIDLSKNKFEGQIPQIIGKLNSIRGLNLSHNKLIGHIPTSLANLTMLEWLDLSSNKLNGEIPQQLKNLKYLEVLNLSQNQLIGPIPQGNQFDTFLNGSYIDNLALCGPPLLNACNLSTPQPPSLMFQQEDNTSSGFNWEVILPGYICGLVWGLVMGYLMFSRGKPQWLVRIIEGERNESRKRFKKHAHRNRGSCSVFQFDLSGVAFGAMANFGQADALHNAGKLQIQCRRCCLNSNRFAKCFNRLTAGQFETYPIGWFDLDGSIDNSGWLSDESNNEEGTEMKSEEIEARIDVLAKRADEKGKLPENTGMENSTQELGAVSTVDMEQETALKQFEQKRVEDNQKTVMAQHPAGGTCDVKVSPTEPDNYLLAAEGAW